MSVLWSKTARWSGQVLTARDLEHLTNFSKFQHTSFPTDGKVALLTFLTPQKRISSISSAVLAGSYRAGAF